MNDTLVELHNQMLLSRPDGATHDTENCPLCSIEHEDHGGKMSDTTYTDSEVQALVSAAVAEATKDLAKDLDDLRATQSVQEWEAKIEEAKAEVEAKVAELQAQLDVKDSEAETAKTALADLTTFLEEAKATTEREAEIAARTEARVSAVKEVATFSEEHLAANAQRWAAMDDESFEALLADYRTMSTAPTGGIPATTALHATRDQSGSGAAAPAASAIIRLRRDQGVDPRNLIR